MWFLRRRRNRSNQEADKALEQAQVAKKEIEARGPEVTRIASALKEMRERNHFAEQLQSIIERNEGQIHDT